MQDIILFLTKINKMELGERIILVVQQSGLNVSKFAQAIGAQTPQAIRDLIKGRTKSLSEEMSHKILSYMPRLNAGWLFTGEGEMLKGNAKEIGGVYSVTSGDEKVVMVDFVPVSATATFIESLSDSNIWEDKLPIIPVGDERNNISDYKIFEVEGDSMLPTLVSGAYILAKEIPQHSWHYVEGVVVAVFGEFVVVKRVESNRLLTENYIVLKSDNEQFGTMTVPLSELRGLYKAKRILNSPIS